MEKIEKKLKFKVLTYDGSKFVQTPTEIDYSSVVKIERMPILKEHMVITTDKGVQYLVSDDIEFPIQNA